MWLRPAFGKFVEGNPICSFWQRYAENQSQAILGTKSNKLSWESGVSFVGGYGAIMGSVVSRCNTLEHAIYYLVMYICTSIEMNTIHTKILNLTTAIFLNFISLTYPFYCQKKKKKLICTDLQSQILVTF